MHKVVRIIGKGLLGLVVLILLVIAVSYAVSALKLGKRYTIQPFAFAVPADSASVARGHVLAQLYGCTGCHTETLAGQVMINQFPMAQLASANLTRGRGGVGGRYTDADWERAIRHGVRPNGEHLLIMPSEAYNRLRDEEVAVLIAYLKTVPPVDSVRPARVIWPIARVLHTFGVPLAAAERIDHSTQRMVNAPPGATVEYGKSVGAVCRFCHGENLAGLAVGGPPGAPPSPNITPRGNPGKWTEADFTRTMRTGLSPEGRSLNPEFMPWRAIGQLRDDELRGIWMYLQRADSVRAADSVAAKK